MIVSPNIFQKTIEYNLRPDTWVHGIVLEDENAVGRNKVGIATGRVLRVGDHTVPLQAILLRKHVHVVSVEMHRMHRGRVVLQDDPDGPCLLAIVHIPLGRVREVALVRQQQHGAVVVNAEGRVVHVPEPVLGRVLLDVHLDGPGNVRGRRRLDLVERFREGQRTLRVRAVAGNLWPGGRRGELRQVGLRVVHNSKRLGLASAGAPGLDLGAHVPRRVRLGVCLDNNIVTLANLFEVR